MLQAYTNLDCNNRVNLEEGDRVVFQEKKVQTGTTATLCSKGEVIYLNKPGFYEVNFEATLDSSTSTVTEVLLHVNGEPDLSTKSIGIPGGSGQFSSVNAFTSIVQVKPNCCPCKVPVELTFIYNTSQNVTLAHANVVVTKLC